MSNAQHEHDKMHKQINMKFFMFVSENPSFSLNNTLLLVPNLELLCYKYLNLNCTNLKYYKEFWCHTVLFQLSWFYFLVGRKSVTLFFLYLLYFTVQQSNCEEKYKWQSLHSEVAVSANLNFYVSFCSDSSVGKQLNTHFPDHADGMIGWKVNCNIIMSAMPNLQVKNWFIMLIMW